MLSGWYLYPLLLPFQPKLCFSRRISSLRHHPPRVRQTIHHIPGAAEVPGDPGGQSRRSGVNRSEQFSWQTGREHLWQKRWLTQRRGERTLEMSYTGKEHFEVSFAPPNDFESSHSPPLSHTLGDVLAFLWCFLILLLLSILVPYWYFYPTTFTGQYAENLCSFWCNHVYIQ